MRAYDPKATFDCSPQAPEWRNFTPRRPDHPTGSVVQHCSGIHIRSGKPPSAGLAFIVNKPNGECRVEHDHRDGGALCYNQCMLKDEALDVGKCEFISTTIADTDR